MSKIIANEKHYILLRNILFEFNDKYVTEKSLIQSFKLLRELNINISLKYDEMLRELLDKIYINLNITWDNRYTFPPILQICLCNFNYTDKLLEILLDNGADPNLQIGRNKLCPLHLAIFLKNKKIVQILLSYNANVNIKLYDNLTPLMHVNNLLTSEPQDLILLEIKSLLLYYNATLSSCSKL